MVRTKWESISGNAAVLHVLHGRVTFLGGLPASTYAPPAPDKLAPNFELSNFEIRSPLSMFPKNDDGGGNGAGTPVDR